MENKLELSWINSLKGIAIFLVVLVHSGSQNMPTPLVKFIAFGARGVQMFFIISAFLAFQSLDRKFNKTDDSKFSIVYRKWVLERFLNIVPLFYFYLFINLVLFGTGPRYWLGNHGSISIMNILSNLLFINGFNPYFINSITGINWYIADLAIFYIVAPFLFKYIKNLKNAFIFLIISTIISYSISYFLLKIIKTDDIYIWDAYFNTFWFVIEFPLMTIGIFLYYIFKEDFIKEIYNDRLLSNSILVFSLFFIAILIETDSLVLLFLYGIGFAGIIVSQFVYKSSLIDNKFWEMLGKRSYGIYLSHFIVIYYFNDKLNYLVTRNLVIQKIFSLVIILLISYFISAIISILIEQPFISYIKKKCNI